MPFPSVGGRCSRSCRYGRSGRTVRRQTRPRLLGRLQIALKAAHDGQKPGGKIAWSDDGSLRVLRAETALSRALGRQRSRIATGRGCDRRRAEAVRCSMRRSTPPMSLVRVSRIRARWHLRFRSCSGRSPTVWEPARLYALLQFSLAPIGPVPVMPAAVGRGGRAVSRHRRPAWREAVRRDRRRHPERAADLRQALGFWVEHTRTTLSRAADLCAARKNPREFATTSARDVRVGRQFAAHPPQRVPHRTAAVTAALEKLAGKARPRSAPRSSRRWCASARRGALPTSQWARRSGAYRPCPIRARWVESFDRIIWWQMARRHCRFTTRGARARWPSLARAGVDCRRSRRC